MMKKRIITFLSLITFFSVNAQNLAWKYYSFSGLNSTVKDLTYDGQGKIYYTHSSGFCVYDLVQEQIDTCFTSPTNTLFTDNSVAWANNRMWMITQSGISSYQAGTITNYTTANGLPSNTIEDIATDTLNRLWIATSSGVAYFDGNTFISSTTRPASEIAIDKDNRVYTYFGSSLARGGALISSRLNVLDQGSWQFFNLTGIDSIQNGGPTLNNANLRNGGEEVCITFDNNQGKYYSLSYPANLSENVFRSVLGGDYTGIISQAFKDKNLRTWLNSNSLSGLMSVDDSVAQHHYIGNNDLSSNYARSIKVFGNRMFAKSAWGVYTADIDIAPLKFYEELDINSIRTGINSVGALFENPEEQSTNFEFPKGNNTHGIYAAGLIVLSKPQGATTFDLNQMNYYENNYQAGAYNNGLSLTGSWITKVSRQDIQNHQANFNNPNYVVPENLMNWRGNGDVSLGMAAQLAPYEDLNSNGVYEPALGDYPKIKGDEALYWINHIDNLEYHGMLYGFNRPTDSALHQSVFLSYEIFNRSNSVLDSVKVGFVMDSDLGNPVDDYVGCDSLRNIFFTYNGDSLDQTLGPFNGYGLNPPFLGVKFLSDTMDGFMSYNLGGGLNGQPNSIDHWRNYLEGKWRLGQNMRYGGDGLNNTTGGPTKYMYTGTPWAEEQPGPGLSPNTPGDRRGVGHIPWFSLQPNQSKIIEMVIGYAQVPNAGNLGSKGLLLNYLDSAANFWDGNVATNLSSYAIESKDGFSMYPNPTKQQLMIELNQGAKQTANSPMQIFSIRGRLVKELNLFNTQTLVDVSDLEAGIYLVRYQNQVKRLVIQ